VLGCLDSGDYFHSLLKYGVPQRNHPRSSRPEHHRGRVRIGRVQLTLYNVGEQHGHTAVLIIQGIQNSVSPPKAVERRLVRRLRAAAPGETVSVRAQGVHPHPPTRLVAIRGTAKRAMPGNTPAEQILYKTRKNKHYSDAVVNPGPFPRGTMCPQIHKWIFGATVFYVQYAVLFLSSSIRTATLIG
jgi:hypothetical protein